MAANEQDKPARPAEGEHGEVMVTVNEQPVTLPKHRDTGLEIKEAAIAQGVEIKLDFILVEEAHEGHEAEVIGDDDTVEVNKHSKFTANDGDDNS